MDNSLFQDSHEAVKTHVAVTFHLPNGHEDKFCLFTPLRIFRCYERIWDNVHGGIPTSKRIIQDVDKMVNSLERITDAKGAVVKGIASREGHRKYVESMEEYASRQIDALDKIINDGRYEDNDDDEVDLDERWLNPSAMKHLRERKTQIAKKIFELKGERAKAVEKANLAIYE